jgi:hypothetical protein
MSRRVVTGRRNTCGRNTNQHCKRHFKDIKQSSTKMRSRDVVFPKVVFREMLQKCDALMFVRVSSTLARVTSCKLSLGLSMKRGEITWTANRQ